MMTGGQYRPKNKETNAKEVSWEIWVEVGGARSCSHLTGHEVLLWRERWLNGSDAVKLRGHIRTGGGVSSPLDHIFIKIHHRSL